MLKVIKIFLVMCEVVGCSDVVDDGFCHHDNNGKWFGKLTRQCEQSRNFRMERLVFAGPNVFGTGGDYLLGEYGRPQLMQLVHVDPFVVYAHRNSLMTPIEKVMLMLPPLVKGVVTDRGVFTFNVDSRAETSDE